MSGTYIGVLVPSPGRRGTWAEYEPQDNIGVLVPSPGRRGTWAEYGVDERSWSIGTAMSSEGWSTG